MATISNPPPETKKKVISTIPATAFAGAYKSTFSSEPVFASILPLLANVNCGYLSTPNSPVTILNLKQHAQALTVLIESLTISTSSSAIEDGTANFAASESFDWLNDLSSVYDNDNITHNTPLTSILNTLEKSSSEPPTYRPICPLHRVFDGPPGTNALPMASLQSLTVHADQVLTMLDHEVSHNGGLLSLLPISGPEADAAQNTILGQWIHFTRALVSRAHELERAYATCLEALSDEATIPRELTRTLGSTARVPTAVDILAATRQDRYVLANVSDEMWAHLDREFGRAREATLDDGRGVTWLDMPTRYARLRGGKTVFIVPEWRQGQKENAERPTVVQVVKPVYPERASAWESKAREALAVAKMVGPENVMLKRKVQSLEADVTVLEGGEELEAQKLRFLKNLERQEEMRARMRREESDKIRAELRQATANVKARDGRIDEEVKRKVEEELRPRVETEVEKRVKEEVDRIRSEMSKQNEVRIRNAIEKERAKARNAPVV